MINRFCRRRLLFFPNWNEIIFVFFARRSCKMMMLKLWKRYNDIIKCGITIPFFPSLTMLFTLLGEFQKRKAEVLNCGIHEQLRNGTHDGERRTNVNFCEYCIQECKNWDAYILHSAKKREIYSHSTVWKNTRKRDHTQKMSVKSTL